MQYFQIASKILNLSDYSRKNSISTLIKFPAKGDMLIVDLIYHPFAILFSMQQRAVRLIIALQIAAPSPPFTQCQ